MPLLDVICFVFPFLLLFALGFYNVGAHQQMHVQHVKLHSQ